MEEIDRAMLQGQKRLLAKRKELGMETKKLDPIKSNIQSMLSAIADKHNRCNTHNVVGLPCPMCEALHARALEEEEMHKAYRRTLEIEKRKANASHYLERCGVRKKYIPCSFDNFIGGDLAKKACMDLLVSPYSLLLSGGTGCGKTHLAVSVFRELVNNLKINSEEDALFVSAPRLLLEIKATFKSTEKHHQTEVEVVDKYSKIRYLIIDDIGAEKQTDWTIQTFYTIVDQRNSDLLTTIYTTNLIPEEIEQYLGPRIGSRLADAKIVRLIMPDFRKKRQSLWSVIEKS